MARAEAQKRELEAERLAAEAESRSQSAEEVRRERDEQLRLADLRDPDVKTDKDGRRLDGGRDGEGSGTVEGTDVVRDGDVDTRRRDAAAGDRSDEVRTEGVETYDERRTGTP